MDADGHIIEFLPALIDCLKQVAGPKVSERFWKSFLDTNARNWHQLTPEERRRGSVYRPAFWAGPAENTRDRATAMLPRLLAERMPELGIDYAVMFPTIGMLLPNMVDEEMRRASCRAENMMLAEMFDGCESRLTPAAIIPCHTPAEALEEMRLRARRARHEGADDRQHGPPAYPSGRQARRARSAAAARPRLLGGPARARQRVRLRPAVAEVHGRCACR